MERREAVVEEVIDKLGRAAQSVLDIKLKKLVWWAVGIFIVSPWVVELWRQYSLWVMRVMSGF